MGSGKNHCFGDTDSGVEGPQRAKSIHTNNTVEAKKATMWSNMWFEDGQAVLPLNLRHECR
jgi:hypothetical protein